MKKTLKFITALLSFTATPAFAGTSGGSGMPWDNALQTIQNDLTGSTAHAMIIIAIAATGIMMAIGEHGSVAKKAMTVVFGGSIAVGAVSLVSTLFGASF